MKLTRLAAPAAAGALAATALAMLPAADADVTTAAPAAATAAELPAEGLEILLTNDDGWNAPGITAVYDALTAAGHDVTMVAPKTNNSGVSAQLAFGGSVTALEEEPGKWSVTTTPAGTVHFGIQEVLDGEEPDLVVSGTNVGANSGFETNYSGTVGAATVAAGAFAVPSVAISTGMNPYTGEPGAYDATADLLVDMIAEGLPILDRGEFLNVNYPILGDGAEEARGVRYAPVADASQAALSYVQDETDPTHYDVEVGGNDEQPAPGTDSALLNQGFATVTVLDANRTVDAADVDAVTDLVAELNGEEPVDPPAPAARVAALPTKVVARTRSWVPTAHIADGERLRVTWRAGRRTVKRSALVRNDVFRLAAPRKGRYRVVVSLDGKRLRAARISVR